MSMKPVFGAALHLLRYLSRAALAKARVYSSTLPVCMLVLYKRSATGNEKQMLHKVRIKEQKLKNGCLLKLIKDNFIVESKQFQREFVINKSTGILLINQRALVLNIKVFNQL